MGRCIVSIDGGGGLACHASVPAYKPKPTLLHLTDLHFGPAKSKGHYWNSEATELELPKHDQRGLLCSLLDDLDDQKLRPDLVLVTGDLLDRSAPQGVKPALSFLSKLADGLRLGRNRVVLIPGNHDVVRVPEPTERYARFDAIREGFYGGLRATFPKRTPPHHRVERFDFADELGIEVVAFNSCEALDAPKQEHGSVGLAQRKRAEALLAASEGKGLFRIALMHHHLERPTGVVRDDFSVMDDAGAVREWLAAHQFQLVLHGHQHVDWERIEDVRGWFLSITAGGSAGVGRYGRAAWDLRLGYQVIVLDSKESGRRIRRQYDPQFRKWLAAGQGDAEVKLRFGAGALASTQGGAGGRTPTRTSLRKLLRKVLPGVAQFDAFCADHFPDVHRQFSSGMQRDDKETILLERHEPDEILARLLESYAESTAKHEGLLAYA